MLTFYNCWKSYNVH